MKAIRYTGYGSPAVVQLAELPTPIPKADEILVRVHEALVTPSDMAMRSGKPFVARLFSGLFRPKGVPGTDFAGVIEVIGAGVTQFKVGDRVFGANSVGGGAHAEYLTVKESGVVAKLPENRTFSETAGLCDAAMTALTFLRDNAALQPGQRILIYGASGSVGTYAIQLAKGMGAHVTAVCSTANVELVRSLGADAVIDYTQQDYAALGQQYDVVFDAVGKSSFRQACPSLTAKGVYMTTVPTLPILGQMLVSRLRGGKRALFDATGLKQTREKLEVLGQLVAEGGLRSILDRTYTLDAMQEAHAYVETGRKRGNIVVRLTD